MKIQHLALLFSFGVPVAGCGADADLSGGSGRSSEASSEQDSVASVSSELILDTLTDRCSGAVALIDTNAGESILMFRNIPGDPLQPFSAPISITNRRLTWLCFESKTTIAGTHWTEHSTCPSGTHHVSARLGPSRLLNIRCLN